jgi:hypothetical protein
LVTDDDSNVTDVLPHKSWEALKDLNGVLVDLRTKAYWPFAGATDMSGIFQKPIQIERLAFPEMSVDPKFKDALFSHFGGGFPN